MDFAEDGYFLTKDQISSDLGKVTFYRIYKVYYR